MSLSGEALPEEAWLTVLAELDGMGPARLRSVLTLGSPAEVWQQVLRGRFAGRIDVRPQRVASWREQAKQTDVSARWRRYLDTGIGVIRFGGGAYPSALNSDPEPPTALFVEGDLASLELPRVAIVGTRRCTRYGAEVAYELGRDLAAAGVCVVSGLALGIDGAAHAGAIEASVAPPVAVVAGGLDRRYPVRNRALWSEIARRGAVVSEAPLGVPPDRWRFPARNRIIAGLVDVVVVVESAGTGGSMYTVTEAMRRDKPVLAVPGPVRSEASVGTNRLLRDGCAPLCDVDDVFTLLGLSAEATLRRARRREFSARAGRILDAFCWQPVDLQTLLQRTQMSNTEASLAVEELLAGGWVTRHGPWLERVALG